MRLSFLLPLLPKLESVVLVGRRAQRVFPLVALLERVFTSAHPSPLVRASRQSEWDQIPSVWAKQRVRKRLTDKLCLFRRSGSGNRASNGFGNIGSEEPPASGRDRSGTRVDVETLSIMMFCGLGLVASLVLVSYGLDLNPGLL